MFYRADCEWDVLTGSTVGLADSGTRESNLIDRFDTHSISNQTCFGQTKV